MEDTPETGNGLNAGADAVLVEAPRRGARKPDIVEVVLVDDSVPVRERVAASLAALDGVEVVGQAGDVPSGLRLLEEREPDVLILDLELPGQSGLDLLKIAKRRGYASVIIMFSIHDHPKLREKCAELGAAFYFNKNSEFELASEVCRKLAMQRRRQG